MFTGSPDREEGNGHPQCPTTFVVGAEQKETQVYRRMVTPLGEVEE